MLLRRECIMINKGIRKIDSTAIVTGKPLYTEDLIMHKDVFDIKTT